MLDYSNFILCGIAHYHVYFVEEHDAVLKAEEEKKKLEEKLKIIEAEKERAISVMNKQIADLNDELKEKREKFSSLSYELEQKDRELKTLREKGLRRMHLLMNFMLKQLSYMYACRYVRMHNCNSCHLSCTFNMNTPATSDKPEFQDLIHLDMNDGRDSLRIMAAITSHPEVKCADFAHVLLKDRVKVSGLKDKHKQDKEHFVRAVLEDWVAHTPDRSWQDLIKAMEHAEMDGEIVNKIKKCKM